MAILKYPYTNLHELNLDWIIEQLNKEGAVLTVNGKHGIVVLTGEDIVRAPNSSETIQQALTAQGASIQAARTLLGTTPMPTTAQTVTGAVDELSGDIADLNEKLGNTQLPTTAQTITGAIAEQSSAISNLTNKVNNEFRLAEGDPAATITINNYPSFVAARDKDSQDGLLMIVTGVSNATTVCKWGSKAFEVTISNGSLTIGNGNILVMAMG